MILAQMEKFSDAEIVEACLVFLFTGLLFIGLALPMVFRKIPPNGFYGWRTPKAFESKDIWYQINWYSGRDMLILGAIQMLFNIFLLCFTSQLHAIINGLVVTGNLSILTAGSILMVIRGLLYLRKL